MKYLSELDWKILSVVTSQHIQHLCLTQRNIQPKTYSVDMNSAWHVPQLTTKNRYYSFQAKIHYEIRDIYSWHNMCHLLDYKECNKQYMGETGTTVRLRVKHHRNATKADINRPIYYHIQSHKRTFNIFTIIIIDRAIDLKEKVKEMEYITLLKTCIPSDLMLSRKYFKKLITHHYT